MPMVKLKVQELLHYFNKSLFYESRT